MRILMAQNSLYYPAHGGGDKSNRLLMEALAARGHTCQVVARINNFGGSEHSRYLAALAARGVSPHSAGGVVRFERVGVDVHVVTNANLRAQFTNQMETFLPEAILTSTDDPAQVLLEVALQAENARVFYLARATLALPFGPDCAFPSQANTERIRATDRVVGVSEYVAAYFRQYAGIDAVHVPISLLEPEQWPELARFENEFVTLVNPCAVKGIAILLSLADAFPDARFAAVPTWGTTQQDYAALRERPNVSVLDPVDNVDELFRRTKVLLVPSLWAEARSRIILEAMLRGVPVMAANVGGIPEAKMGVPYLLPVSPIAKFHTRLDEQMVPVPLVPQQNIGPWQEALKRLLTDSAHYQEISRQSRAAALEYARTLSVGPFETLLEQTPRRLRLEHQPANGTSQQTPTEFSADRRRLLALRLRRKAPPSAWFPGADAVQGPRLFWFPHAGGGAASFKEQIEDLPYSICPVRLPGRDFRLPEAPFDRMEPLVEALANAFESYLGQPFCFFGHSMGAVVAFELARLLRRRAQPLPKLLIASAARAPQYRRNHQPPPEPSDRQFLEELLRMDAIPKEILDTPFFTRAILPALKADASLYRHYVYSEDSPFDFPVRAYGGADDPNIHLEHLEAWAEQTTSSFGVRLFPGGHFYIRGSPPEFGIVLKQDLRIIS